MRLLSFRKELVLMPLLEEEEGWRFHKYLQKKLAEKGWISRAWPKEYGGQEASLVEQLIFNEVRSYYRSPGIDLWGVGMFAPTLLVAASEEQKQRLLPPIAKGEVHYCQGWSEPNAGSDLASLQAKAIKEGDHYIVNGQKTWSTGLTGRTASFFCCAPTRNRRETPDFPSSADDEPSGDRDTPYLLHEQALYLRRNLL